MAEVEEPADAEGPAIMLLFIVCPLCVALGVALGVALADAEVLAILLSSIICPLGIMCLPLIC